MKQLSEKQIVTFSRQLILSNWSEEKQLHLQSLQIAICSSLEASICYLEAAGAKSIQKIDAGYSKLEEKKPLLLLLDLSKIEKKSYPSIILEWRKEIPTIEVNNNGIFYSEEPKNTISLANSIPESSALSHQALAASKIIQLLANAML